MSWFNKLFIPLLSQAAVFCGAYLLGLDTIQSFGVLLIFTAFGMVISDSSK